MRRGRVVRSVVAVAGLALLGGAPAGSPVRAATLGEVAVTGYPADSGTVAVAVRIRDVQAATHVSPLAGQVVTLAPSIVTAVRGSGSARGYYLQDTSPDADEATSEGIFVFTGGTTPPVDVGDEVVVTGTVAEFRGGGPTSPGLTVTEITGPASTVLSSDNALPAPAVIGIGGRVPPTEVISDETGDVETGGVFDPAQDGIDFYESLEGMLVQVNNAVASGPRTGFGEISVLADNGAGSSVRTARGGVVVRPADFNPERIIVDDSIAATAVVNVGDHFSAALIGVMDYSFNNFKLNIASPVTAVSDGVTPETTTAAGPGELAVATLNVENLDPGDSPDKITRLAAIIVDNMRSPDLLSLEEVQDNSGPADDAVVDASASFEALIDAITAAGGPAYEFRQVNPDDDADGGEPGGNIRVGFLFRTDQGLSFVDRPGGDATTPVTVAPGPRLSASPGRVDPANPAFVDSRKPLAGEFVYRGSPLFRGGQPLQLQGRRPAVVRQEPAARALERGPAAPAGADRERLRGRHPRGAG